MAGLVSGKYCSVFNVDKCEIIDVWAMNRSNECIYNGTAMQHNDKARI